MPNRRRGLPSPPLAAEALSESEEEFADEGVMEGEEEEMIEEMDEEEEEEEGEMGEEEEELLASPPLSPSHLTSTLPHPNFREISTLASWTVSSSKPGCSIPQLRHPSTQQFWQSDGPQPHYLNIHFFKLVRIVGLRLYLDFEADESYTPTRIVLLAGSGMNDLVEWGEMKLESPRGWIWADFEGVGDVDSEDDDDSDEEDGDEENAAPSAIAGAERRTHIEIGTPDNRAAQVPNNEDSTSDFENTAPHTHTAHPPPTTAATPNDPMMLDPTPDPAAPPIHHHHQQHATHNNNNTPTLPRPHPRHPFTPLSPNPSTSLARKKKPKLPVLRCHLVQIKILENHQNGKDTHLRGLQIFALDGEKEGVGEGRRRGVMRKKIAGGGVGRLEGQGEGGKGGVVVKERKKAVRGLARSAWMGEPPPLR
ncbi:galactose-binding like protein [Byssothecium circinans]|uniref:Galactose-binding like protein n=1 Tax=Byssothecium circinans TaxID=147558 RepID=A0A6A5TQ19_9PLEO|nr:galactose-binding like protein [Byssothecium circinans]